MTLTLPAIRFVPLPEAPLVAHVRARMAGLWVRRRLSTRLEDAQLVFWSAALRAVRLADAAITVHRHPFARAAWALMALAILCLALDATLPAVALGALSGFMAGSIR